MKVFIVLVIIFSSFLGTSCATPGSVFVMIVWDEAIGKPTSLVHNLPGVPVLASITNGQYYKLTSTNGTYSVGNIWYGPAGPFNISNFTLPPNNTILGAEDAYYDIVIFNNVNPKIKKVPNQDYL
jgi:hypothetical protein